MGSLVYSIQYSKYKYAHKLMQHEEEMKGKLHTQGRRKEDKIDDGTY